MLPWLRTLLEQMLPDFGAIRVLGYISVRAGLALTASFIISLLIGRPIIRWLTVLKVGQQVRKMKSQNAVDLFEMHGSKSGTPTMGGLLIAVSLFISTILFASLTHRLVWVCALVILGLGVIGFLDDYLKVTKRNHKGLSARIKLGGQILVGGMLGLYMILGGLHIVYGHAGIESSTHLIVPFFKNLYPNLGWLFIPFAILVLTASSNAVNLTDGLDGLAAGCASVCALAFAIVTYLVSRQDWADYLLVPYVPGAGELTVILCALIGSLMGFLWFNAHPAQVFMGDIGSLTIGGLLGAVAILIRQEILLAIIGGIFVVEAMSVIIQVASFKTTGKRVFRMAPLHHHFEKLGMPESRIVMRFLIVAALLALLGLSTLKLR